MLSNRPYSPIEQQDEEDGGTEKLLGQWFDSNGRLKLSQYRIFWNRYWAYLTHGLLLFIISILFFCLWIQARPRDSEELVYCKSVYFYYKYYLKKNIITAPANVAVEYNKGLTTLNGSLDFPSEFRGYPTPEIDAAWTRVSIGGKNSIPNHNVIE